MKSSDIAIATPSKPRLDLTSAAIGARVRTTITGASTLTVMLPDSMLTSTLGEASNATAADRDWTLVSIKRTRDRVSLVYEDALIATLRTHTQPIMWQVALAAGDVIARFCGEAGVPVTIDPVLAQIPVEGAGRSLLERTSSWQEIGSLVDRLGGRVYSTGSELVVSTDATLLERPAPRITSARGALPGDIDFSLDVAQSHDRAAFTVDRSWSIEAGSTVELYRSGPADGRWLVAEYDRELPSAATGRVRLTRPHTIGS